MLDKNRQRFSLPNYWKITLVILWLIIASSSLIGGFSRIANAASTTDPIVGDWNVGASQVVTISGTSSSYTEAAKSPIHINGSSCNVPPGTTIATFSGSGNTYSGQAGLWYISNCSFARWTSLSLTLNGNTLSGFLGDGETTTLTKVNSTCPLGTTLSGPSWVRQFPQSSLISDLAEPFRTHTTNFYNALIKAHASVAIVQTYRPPQRAYLMHYAYLIAQKGLNPNSVPPRSDVPICWVYTNTDGSTNLVQSKQAAAQMVRTYGIVYAPAYPSNHEIREAIDMSISWSGTLHIIDASGKGINISTLPHSGMNAQLWQVGRTYQVFKLASDPPHWSYNGA